MLSVAVFSLRVSALFLALHIVILGGILDMTHVVVGTLGAVLSAS